MSWTMRIDEKPDILWLEQRPFGALYGQDQQNTRFCRQKNVFWQTWLTVEDQPNLQALLRFCQTFLHL